MRHLLLLVLLFAVLSRAPGQEQFVQRADRAYGLDHELVNGIQYYNRYLSYQGHPYFLDDEPVEGTVTVREKEYRELQLRFDIYSACLELSYQNFSGGNNRLVLISDHLDGFSLGEYRFSRLEGDRVGKVPFYQVVGTESYTSYIGWKKTVASLNNSTTYSGEFTDPTRDYLLERDGQLLPFRGRREFVRLFPEASRKELIRLLRKRGASFRHDRPHELIGHFQAVSDRIQQMEVP